MISELFRYEFLQNAFLTGIFIGWVAPLLGVFIVMRRLSLIADALSHVTLSGIAASLWIGRLFPSLQWINPLYAGMGFAVCGALLIEKFRTVYKSHEELAIPVIMSLGIGLGVIFISLANGFTSDLYGFLFGSINAVTRFDFLVVLLLTLAVTAAVFLLFKEFFLLSFDEDYGKTSGLPVRALQLVFIVLAAVVVSVSIRIVGVLLVSSLMTLPVASAMRLAKSFRGAVVLSVVFGEISVIAGLLASYYLDLAPGGTIVVISGILLLFSLLNERALKARRTVGRG